MDLDLSENRVANSKKESVRINGSIKWLCIAMVVMVIVIFLALIVLVGVKFFDVMYPP